MHGRPAPERVGPAPPRRLRRGGGPGSLRRTARRFGFGRALSLALLALLLAIRIWDPAPVEAVRLRTFDAFQVLKPRVPHPAKPVMIVDIDEASLRELGQWPWARTRVAELVSKLTTAGAVVIAFDIVFAEPDRLSPALVADALSQLDEATRTTLRSLPSNDEVLAGAMKASRVILGQTALGHPAPWPDPEPPPQTGIGRLGPDPARFLPSFPGLLRNVPVLEKAALGRGLFTILPERDGIVRRVPMVVRAEGAEVPTLSLEILRILTGGASILMRSDEAGVQSVRLPGFEMQTDPHGQVWVHFTPHDPSRFLSAKDVLAGRFAPEQVANKIVLVGTSAIGLLDNKTTPLERAMPGVEVHAQVLESALTGQVLSSPSYAAAIEILVTVAVAVAIILFAPILGAVPLLLFGTAVAACLAAASWYRYSHSGLLLDATFPLGASFLVYLTLVFTNYFREQVDRSRIRSAFGQYLSPALVEQLAQNPEKLRLGGEERLMTIMFSDVRGFTTISESYKRDPQGLTALMNRFLTPLTNAILDRQGTIDKYMGDAIMAFWNAPLDDPKQEENACAAALDMLRRLKAVNAEREREAAESGQAFIPLDIGIGINTGPCVVGNMGSNLRFDYSVLGDTVNLASRLEGQSKLYGVKVVLGAASAAKVTASFAVLEIDLIRVKGKKEPERVFALLGDADLRGTAEFGRLAETHADMIARYRAGDWDGAEAALEDARELAEGLGISGLYELYAGRIAAFRAEPPPPDWAGVYVALSK
ncbi:CHASE2 domain-containing protein [Enterovirga aerilata]|uniref:Adenylate/guanylate cyclase domain-containing protein n=1 Tax=Enterovirga aerilata TaxID=2730920 RepID=A0A849IA78_9HYPH|nr:adenylate/guanylate cyclase domain-containing protein [Enterovirga sp. DB1703]NNM73175.1 adenylate/guanylate cyclase domain-containing protein [Enterovirga sp. DB1703]